MDDNAVLISVQHANGTADWYTVEGYAAEAELVLCELLLADPDHDDLYGECYIFSSFSTAPHFWGMVSQNAAQAYLDKDAARRVR